MRQMGIMCYQKPVCLQLGHCCKLAGEMTARQALLLPLQQKSLSRATHLTTLSASHRPDAATAPWRSLQEACHHSLRRSRMQLCGWQKWMQPALFQWVEPGCQQTLQTTSCWLPRCWRLLSVKAGGQVARLGAM